MAFTSPCPLQCCKPIQSRRRRPQPRRSRVSTTAETQGRNGGGWRRKRKKTRKQDGQSFKSVPTTLGQGPRPHRVPFSPMVPLFAPGQRQHSWPLQPPSATDRQRGARSACPRTSGLVSPQRIGLSAGTQGDVPLGPGPKPRHATSRLWGRRQNDVTVAGRILIVPHSKHSKSYALFQRLTVCSVPRVAF